MNDDLKIRACFKVPLPDGSFHRERNCFNFENWKSLHIFSFRLHIRKQSWKKYSQEVCACECVYLNIRFPSRVYKKYHNDSRIICYNIVKQEIVICIGGKNNEGEMDLFETFHVLKLLDRSRFLFMLVLLWSIQIVAF